MYLTTILKAEGSGSIVIQKEKGSKDNGGADQDNDDDADSDGSGDDAMVVGKPAIGCPSASYAFLRAFVHRYPYGPRHIFQR